MIFYQHNPKAEDSALANASQAARNYKVCKSKDHKDTTAELLRTTPLEDFTVLK